MQKETIFVVFLVAGISIACKCVPPTVYSSSRVNADVVSVYLNKTAQAPSSDAVAWNGTVTYTYKGCLKKGTTVTVVSSNSSAACGVTLQVNKTYLLTGDRRNKDDIYLFVVSCSYNGPYDDLRAEEISFINNILNPCTDACATGHEVSCFADPCSVSHCNVPDAECESNYCNGCHAYWWTKRDERVCF